MKAVSYNQRNGGHRKALCPEAPQGPAQYQFRCSVVSYSLRPHEPTPRVHPNPCPLCQWCPPTISSSVFPFSLPSIFPSFRVFSNESALHMRWLKYWSFSFNISPSNEYSGLIFLRIRTGWISLQSKGLSRVFSNTTVQKHQFFSAQLSLKSNSHIHRWLLEKP